MVVLVMGLPGSGKTFFSLGLAKAFHADYISSDRLRKNMFKKRTYSSQEKEQVYDEMLSYTRQYLIKKNNLILDATFYKNKLREKFLKEALNPDDMAIIEVTAPESIIKDRLGKKREDSEADFEIYKIIKAAWEPCPEEHLVLQSADDNIENMLQEAKNYLHLIQHGKGTGR